MGRNKKLRQLRKECKSLVEKNDIILNPENQFDINKVSKTIYKKAKKDLLIKKGR